MALRVVQTYDSLSKLQAITACDDAYTISVINRSNFESLFKKIDSNAEFLIAKEDSEVIGYAAMYANDYESKAAFLTLLCVKSNYHRGGVGSMLINNCIDKAVSNGMETIRLEVLKKDTGAISFYKHHGFNTTDEQKADSIFMEKSLKAN